MKNILLLVPDFRTEVLRGVIEHFIVYFIIAAAVILLSFLFKRVTDLSARFVQSRVYGKWITTLIKQKPGEATQDRPRPRQLFERSWEQTRGGITYRSTEQWLAGATDSPRTIPHESAELHQLFNKVWGKTESKKESSVTYEVRGRIIGEKLSLVYREKGGADSGAILLIIKSKDLMEGYEVGCDQSGIYASPYKWERF